MRVYYFAWVQALLFLQVAAAGRNRVTRGEGFWAPRVTRGCETRDRFSPELGGLFWAALFPFFLEVAGGAGSSVARGAGRTSS